MRYFFWFSLSRFIVCRYFFFFFNDTATTEIYPLSLHDALPISRFTVSKRAPSSWNLWKARAPPGLNKFHDEDRKSTRLNSSHTVISYAVFCLKKKTTMNIESICESHHLDVTLREMRQPNPIYFH